jgi:predicted ATPase
MAEQNVPIDSAERFSVALNRVRLQSGDVLTIPDSGITVITGPNNSGKSTLLRQITTHLRHGPQGTGRMNTFLVAGIEISHSGTTGDAWAWLEKHATTDGSGTEMRALLPDASQAIPARNIGFILDTVNQNGLQGLNDFLVFYGDAWQRLSNIRAAEIRDSFDSPPTAPLHILQDNQDLFAELCDISKEVFRVPLTLDRLSKAVNLRVGETKVSAPPIDGITAEYRDALASLPRLTEQGDGMKSLLGLLIPLITSTYQIVFIDEPEAFLHPPQAAALGRILGEQARSKGLQIILATHDRNFLSGVLESSAPVSIVRLDRPIQGATTASQLNVDDLKSMWEDPVLRYSNVLDGLFHRLAVLAEGDRDCRFYQAALSEYATKNNLPFPPGDVLFIPSGGKDNLRRLVKILRSAHVPVIATPDLDVLNNRETLKALVASSNATWSDIERDYETATAPFRQARDVVQVAHVLAALRGAFSGREEERFTTHVRQEFMAQVRAKESPWASLKRFGVRAFQGESAQAAQRLIEKLDRVGIVLVEVGELEGFAHALGVAKGAAWLPAALDAGAHRNRDAQDHVARLLSAGVATPLCRDY